MEYKNRLIMIVTLSCVAIFSGCDQSKSIEQLMQSKNKGASSKTTIPHGPPQFCPQAQQIIKKNELWQTQDTNWQSYTPSIATKIESFIGAQWVGINIGKIICLYSTNTNIAFPVALEQKVLQEALEPQGGGWSALANNRKFCNSSSVADCSYFVISPTTVTPTNIYNEIDQYDPSSANNY